MLSGIIAIIGRPNVGKSTLFNRLTKTDQAIIDDRPGVTRDRIYGNVSCVLDEDQSYIAVDTGGFETKDHYFQPFKDNIVWQQTQQAIAEADVVLMVFDGKAGLHPHDKELMQMATRLDKPVVYLVNKVDGKEQLSQTFEFYELGIENLLSCSAAHNRGIWEVSEALENQLKQVCKPSKENRNEQTTKLALIGRPNAGKSSILNRICGEERSLVSDVAGTTRDAINANVNFNQRTYEILDTAGIRRKTKISDKVESLSVVRSLRAIEDADVVVLVITADEGISDQDARLASLAINRCKPLLIVVNKWDLYPDKSTNSAKEFELDLKLKLADTAYVPVLFTSCTKNQRVSKILQKAEELALNYHKRASTAKVNEVIQKAVREHTPALMRTTNKKVKFYFATQVKTAPPTFVIKCNVADQIQESYKRYLQKRLRRDLGFQQIPLKILYRGKDEERKEDNS
jgi:GTP-binding protein